MKNVIRALLPVFDFVLLPFLLVSGLIMKTYRRASLRRLPRSTKMLKQIGVFPVIDHYYDPLFNDAHLVKELSDVRNLPGLDLNRSFQLTFINNLRYQGDFEQFMVQQAVLPNDLQFEINNSFFGSGDAEFLFNFVRYLKPRNIVEVDCGTSTKIIASANKFNSVETGFFAMHTCIEPYEQPWLDNFPSVLPLRKKIEEIDLSLFKEMGAGDLLFIDSSHIIRPQGDVLFEYLEIIPTLRKGVYIHVHDIFTPRDYPASWIKKDVKFWNEQYLLEATLSKNESYEIIAALNYLKHQNFAELKKVCPYLTEQREPGSFYFKVK